MPAAFCIRGLVEVVKPFPVFFANVTALHGNEVQPLFLNPPALPLQGFSFAAVKGAKEIIESVKALIEPVKLCGGSPVQSRVQQSLTDRLLGEQQMP